METCEAIMNKILKKILTIEFFNPGDRIALEFVWPLK